jgi:multiple sugar transport system substrate-binding protein
MTVGGARPAAGRRERTRLSRRRILAAGAGAGGLALAACGPTPGGGASQSGAPPGSTQPATLLWQIRSGPTYQQLATWAVGEFQRRRPNVTIEPSADTTGNFEKTTAMMVAGSGPDIFHGWGRLMVQYAAKGVMFNHNDLIKDLKPADVNDFVEYQWKGLVIPTTSFRYGLPTYVNMFVLYFNKALFLRRGQKEPTADWTHDDYATALKQMTFAEGDKRVWGGFARIDIPDRQYHVKAFGGHYVDPKDLTKSQLHLAPAQQALEWQRARLWTDQSWAPIDAKRRTWQPDHQWDGFGQGVLATIEDGLHGLQSIAQKASGFEWNITHIPKGPAKRDSLVTTDSWALWKSTKAKDAGWEFLKFLTSKEFYDQQAKIEGLIPSRKSALDTWVSLMKEKLAALPGFNFKVVTDGLTTMNYLTVDEVFLCQNEAERVLSDGMTQVFVNGEKPASHFRDIQPQLDQMAGGCGASFS